jgi:mannose-6-phosphate isomerase
MVRQYEGCFQAFMRYRSPLPLLPNRVWRVYAGGKLLDRFQGKENPADDHCPEEWVGSATRAANVGREHLEREGLSRCFLPDGGTPFLKDLIEDNPVDFLGREHFERFGAEPALLVKLLDSCVRLPIQAHPTREFAKKSLNSDYGKAEAWIVLGGREIDGPPSIYFGFKEGIGKEDFIDAYKRQDIQALEGALNRRPARRGDVYFIPGGVPHAVGSGVFLLEIQEPTDFAFLLDKKSPSWDLSPCQVHLGLGDELMFEGFDFQGPRGADLFAECYRHVDLSRIGVTNLLPESAGVFFGARHVVVESRLERAIETLLIGICSGGAGSVTSMAGSIEVAPGRSFVVPAAAGAVEYTAEGGALEIFEAFPPAAGL